jgi:predicted nucleotidyltransferase
MSSEKPFTKDNLDAILKELAKEFRKLNGTKMPAEIVLIGGAAVLANYGFRELTYDIDAIILASSVMKDAINHIADKFGLPDGWLNADFQKTASFSKKLLEVSVYYKTFSNILQVRTVSGEYLLAMKVMAGRKYKHDLSDMMGILWESQQSGNPISRESIQKAVEALYESWDKVPETSKKLLDAAFESGDYKSLYEQYRESEKQPKEILKEFDEKYPNTLKGENIDVIIERAKQKRRKDDPGRDER